jgi:hypothetical protein
MKQVAVENLGKYTPSSWEEELLQYLTIKQLYKLEAVYGVNYVYIHREPTPAMIAAIGSKAARILSDNYGVSWIYIPKVLHRFKRNKQIARKINAGYTILELAPLLGIKTTAIKEILRKKFGYKVADKTSIKDP